VVGVMPPRFSFAPSLGQTGSRDVGPAKPADRSANREGHSLRPFARLSQGSRGRRRKLNGHYLTRLARPIPDSDASPRFRYSVN